MFEQRSEFGEIHTWMEDEQIRSYLISNILWCNRQSHPNDVLDRNKDCALRWCSRQHTHTRSNTAIWRWFIRLWAEHWFWIHSISKNGCRLAMASPLSTFHLFQHSGPIFFFLYLTQFKVLHEKQTAQHQYEVDVANSKLFWLPAIASRYSVSKDGTDMDWNYLLQSKMWSAANLWRDQMLSLNLKHPNSCIESAGMSVDDWDTPSRTSCTCVNNVNVHVFWFNAINGMYEVKKKKA